MKKTFIAIAATTAVFAAQAQSQGFYLGAGVGINSVSDSSASQSAELVSLLGGTATTTMDKNVNNLRLVGGYKVNENVAIEVGYINTSNVNMSYAGTSGSSVAYTGAAKISYSGLDVSAVLRPSVASGYNNFFATVGIHNYKSKSSVTLSGNSTVTSSVSDSGSGTMFGVGYDWKIQKDLDLRLAVTRLNKLAGKSGDDSTNYGVGLIKHF